jgi:hypothetical protein
MTHRIYSLFLFGAFISSICGGVHASESKTISLFLQEALDTRGRQAPVSPTQEKFISFLEHETGLRFKRVQLPWNRAKMMAIEGKGIIWAMSKTPERIMNYYFSEPVLESRIWAVSYGNPPLALNVA